MATHYDVLPATKGTKHRAITWTPCDPAAGCCCDGKLTVATEKSYRVYAVTQTYPDPAYGGGRAFRLVKGGGETRDVFLGFEPTCDCPAHTYRGQCIHVDSCQALLQWLPDPRANPGADTGPTEVTEQDPPTEELDAAELAAVRAKWAAIRAEVECPF